jgi:hypothetical protein
MRAAAGGGVLFGESVDNLLVGGYPEKPRLCA